MRQVIAREIDTIVIGGSAGALDVLGTILAALPISFTIPLAIVLHLPPSRSSGIVNVLQSKSTRPVKEVDANEPIASGMVYIAPPNYHLLIERTRAFALSVDEPVHFSRPAIDVLFETAADALGSRLAGVLLTGANEDGARGLLRIQEAGGTTIVQSPETALASTMPQSALRLLRPDLVLTPNEIGPMLCRLDVGVSRTEGR